MESQIIDFFTASQTFRIYGLGQDVEAVVDILWKISYPILHIIYLPIMKSVSKMDY
jgi:hypothetical protein